MIGLANPGRVKREVYDFYCNYPYPSIPSIFSKTHRQLMRRIFLLAGYRSVRGLRVLDAGCGTGEKSVYLALNGAEVTAVDFSPSQLCIAKSLADKYNVDIDFVQADISNVDLKKKFDFVLCLGVLHHMPDFHEGFCNVSRHTEEGGRIVLGLYNKYGRLRYRIERKLLRILNGNDPNKIMNFIMNSPFAFPLRTASRQTLYDRYAVPYETYHTLEEVRQLFSKNKFSVLGIHPRYVYSDLVSQLVWLLSGKSFFFVFGEKKEL
ncbi:MAG: class I SAM-dependent methyltransferase [Candidatus Micrarchaeia archaeon]